MRSLLSLIRRAPGLTRGLVAGWGGGPGSSPGQVARGVGLVALIAAFGAVAPGASALDMQVEGSVLYLDGEIVSRDLRKMRRALQRNPGLEAVVLLDVPGSNDDETNAQIIRLIRNAGLTTYLLSDSHVASGGTDLFLAGKRRIIERGAEIGVHSWAAGSQEGRDLPRSHPDHQLFLRLYAELGIPQAFYWFTLEAAPADGMHYMTERELRAYGLVTEPFRTRR